MKVWRIMREVLSEIFDEAAYARFCTREALPRGRDSYAEFLRESNTSRGTKVRCC
jgi:hypothetical protein